MTLGERLFMYRNISVQQYYIFTHSNNQAKVFDNFCQLAFNDFFNSSYNMIGGINVSKA